jgi:hypothetical protein
MVNTIRDADGRGVNLAVYGVTKIKKNEPELPEFSPITYGGMGGLFQHYLRSETEPGRLNLQFRMKLKDKGDFVRKCRELQYRLRHCFVTFKKEEGMEYELTQSGGVKIEQLGETSAVLTIPFTYEIWGNTVEVPVTELNQVVQIAGAKPTDLELEVTLVSPVPELYVLNIMGVTLTQIVTSQPITISKTMALRNGITIPRFPTGVGETVVQISGSVLNQPLSELSQIVSSLILRYRARW